MTPTATQHTQKSRKIFTIRVKTEEISSRGPGERGKMLEGLRLGFSTVSKKISKNTEKIIRKLENFRGDSKTGIEVASPPHNIKVRMLNPKTNPFARQNKMKPLRSMSNERKDVIGPQQGLQARTSYCDQLGRPDQRG
jgi:hypothetical protein